MHTHRLPTDRLELRPAVEADRSVFVDLFCRDDFMVFSSGTMSAETADARFDAMLETGSEIPFAKQPVSHRSSGQILGYCGVAWFDFEGRRRLEFGYRFIPEARGRGYATEAGTAILDLAAASFDGELLAMIDPTNASSKRVAAKLGFDVVPLLSMWATSALRDSTGEQPSSCFCWAPALGSKLLRSVRGWRSPTPGSRLRRPIENSVVRCWRTES